MDKKKAATEIVRTLQKKGYEALFAGGCVRDQIRRVKCEDYDIATSCKPDKVQKIFPKTVAIGKQFGVIIVLKASVPFEITTFRSEGPYKDGRHPSFVKFTSLKEDALRRDFTVNGLYFDPISNKLHDFVGGVNDIKKKIIRTIGDPDERFDEDKLRLLRAIRFASSLGYTIEKNTWKTIQKRASEITQVSQERIRDEIVKMLTRANAGLALTLLDESHLLEHILPEVKKMKGVEQPPEHHPEGDVFIHTRMLLDQLKNPSKVLALAALLHDVGKPDTFERDAKGIHFYGHSEKGVEMSEEILKRLRFSNQEIEHINACVGNHMKFINVQQMRPAKLKRFMMTETFPTELELHKIDCLASHKKLDNYRFLVKKLKDVQKDLKRGKPPITGQHLIKLGFKPGPMFGKILTEVQDEWLEGRIKTARQAQNWVQKHYKK